MISKGFMAMHRSIVKKTLTHGIDSFNLFSSITNALDDTIVHPDTVNMNDIRIEAVDGVGFLAGFSLDL